MRGLVSLVSDLRGYAETGSAMFPDCGAGLKPYSKKFWEERRKISQEGHVKSLKPRKVAVGVAKAFAFGGMMTDRTAAFTLPSPSLISTS